MAKARPGAASSAPPNPNPNPGTAATLVSPNAPLTPASGEILQDQDESVSFGIQGAGPGDLVLGMPDPLTTLRPPPALLAAKEALKGLINQKRQVSFAAGPGGLGPADPGANVIGMGVGPKFSDGRFTGQLAVQVYVAKKLDPDQVDEDQAIPSEINGFPTDVVESPVFKALGAINGSPTVFSVLEQPAKCGSSFGEQQSGSGTIGCLIAHETQQDICYMLSNTHVLADSNGAQPGALVVQPGTADFGPRQALAVLARFMPLQRAPGQNAPGSPVNTVDCALALVRRNLVNPSHHTFTINPGPVQPAALLPVCKEGRTTGFQSGRIVSTNFSTDVQYEIFRNGQVVDQFWAHFENQLVVEHDVPGQMFSNTGDSGSLVVTLGTKQPVGLLFAGGPTPDGTRHLTMVNPIAEVMRVLNFRTFLAQ